jgi:hypothetical protein
VEFEVTAAPGVGQTLQCSIDPGYGIAGDWTFWFDEFGFDEPGLSIAPCAYTFAYVAPPPIHDVAVTNLASAKTIVGQGCCGNLTTIVENQGNFTETVNVTVYANTTSIASQNVTLSAGDFATVTFTWNTTSFDYGNYTISAYAWPVAGETNTADNNFTGGWVIVSLVGDLTGGPNGVPDGKVDIKDVHDVAVCYGTTMSSPNWNPNADINNDGKVDIRDVHLAAVNYGQHYP